MSEMCSECGGPVGEKQDAVDYLLAMERRETARLTAALARAEREREEAVAELAKCAWHKAIEEATEDAAAIAADRDDLRRRLDEAVEALAVFGRSADIADSNRHESNWLAIRREHLIRAREVVERNR